MHTSEKERGALVAYWQAVLAVETEWAAIKADLAADLETEAAQMQRDFTEALKSDCKQRCNRRVREIRDEWQRQTRSIERARASCCGSFPNVLIRLGRDVREGKGGVVGYRYVCACKVQCFGLSLENLLNAGMDDICCGGEVHTWTEMLFSAAP